ncbi:MAG TPA: hypothetical protein EYP89_00710 [Candidatus Omnitrophica bacterium]|nr:hypothetical protein [Candidatus Omnitrophota bacterium]
MIKKGVVLLLSLFVIVVLAVLGMAILFRSISERFLVQRFKESTQAFWLAEAGISKAIKELKEDFDITGSCLWLTDLGVGQYCVDISVSGDNKRLIKSYGYIPSKQTYRIKRTIEVEVRGNLPPSTFYSDALYSAGKIEISGNAYHVVGDVRYAESINNTNNIDGTVIHDPSINPLLELDFQQLLEISQSQGNYYNEERLQEIREGNDSFPTNFWYTEPTNPNDPTTGTPNVVYIEGDLELNGNVEVGGFFIVMGEEAEINGNGQIEGAVYISDKFEIHGGGNNLNLNGGIWAGGEIELKGHAEVVYNGDYMQAIQSLIENISSLHIISWRDKPSPYPQSE